MNVRNFVPRIVAVLSLAVLLLGGMPAAERLAGISAGAHAQQAAPAEAGKSDVWRSIRQGEQGYVSIPDKKAGVLVQSEGENWRAFRNGPLSTWGVWGMVGILGLLALFFIVRGRIRIEHGPSGRLIERFNGLERFSHWLTAVSFIVLGLTGLNILYGRYVLLPVIGPDAFSVISLAGKYMHNYIAFAFMLGLVLILVLWIKDNIPSRLDLTWFAQGGGIFSKHKHPPAKKFNAGQKIIFWAVVLGGFSVSLSGIALMFPFEFAFFGKTFAALNIFGFGLPENLTMMQEMQLSQLWHAIVALVLLILIIAHIYIGTIGMEGAFDAMGSGMVDENWAKEHHSLWVEEVKEEERKARLGGRGAPAPGDDD
jgi:formate dehydrogenase subunit gamma